MNYPHVGVAVIIRNNNKILMTQRKSEHAKGTWGFPGGKLEFGESFVQCVKRELKEETGLKVKDIKFAALTNDIFNKESHYITVFMTADYNGGMIINAEPEKHTGWKWVSWKRMPHPLMLPIVNLLKQHFDPFKQP